MHAAAAAGLQGGGLALRGPHHTHPPVPPRACVPGRGRMDARENGACLCCRFTGNAYYRLKMEGGALCEGQGRAQVPVQGQGPVPLAAQAPTQGWALLLIITRRSPAPLRATAPLLSSEGAPSSRSRVPAPGPARS